MFRREGTQMKNASENAVERTLRWMDENLMGAYNAKHPPGHLHERDHCTNSGTCILVCCYINALGKVLLKGGPPKRGRSRHVRPDFERFREFLRRCMSDFLSESDAMNLPQTPRGRTGGDEWLYEVFRCGFIHGYPSGNVAWGRCPRSSRYWLRHQGRLTLNLDQLVRGFRRGIEEFQRIVAGDDDLRSLFDEYITAE